MVKKKSTKALPLQMQEFYSDYVKKDMLYAALVRSSAATGAIADVVVPDLPDGCFFFSAHDIPGKNSMRTNGADTEIFCTENVSYKGQPLGIIVCPDEMYARNMAEKIAVTFEGQHDALVAQLSKTVAERTVKTGAFLSASKTAITKIFKSADFDISGTWSQTIADAQWTETNGACCFMENNMLTILAPVQWSWHLKTAAASALGIDEERIIVETTNTYGHRASKLWRSETLAIQTVLASYLTQKPVKLTLSRAEQEAYMKSNIPVEITCRSAVKKDGTITAMHIEITVDVGSCNPFAQEILDRLAIAACNVYNIPNICINAKAVSSAKPPTSVFPDAIDSQSFFAIESHLQKIANELAMLPHELRVKNIAENQKRITTPFLFHTERMHAALARVLATSDFCRKYTSFKRDALQHDSSAPRHFSLPVRGIGIACAFDGATYLNNELFSQKIAITLNEDGSVSIHSPVPSPQIADIWTHTVSTMLAIPASSVKIVPDNVLYEKSLGHDNIYSNISVMSYLLHSCCRELEKKRAATKHVSPLTVKKGISPTIKKLWNRYDFCGTPFYSVSYGSAVIEILIDPYTYNVHSKGIWLAIDCGHVLDVRHAENSIRLSLQQELSQLILNETITCDRVHISFIQSDIPPVQIGNLVHNIIPAAFSSALSLALSSQVHELPCTLETLYKTIARPRGDE
ncbi:MAG: xanthine dehydrogenase family protein [Treponema sp.]|nr:xanthine dehydrogenase family protein [Treponema sp.]